ncbi:MAG: hypothetical protein IJ035_01190 [Oscillospiraceae bacterium]|nr:hypothetical protein [Oscillospiraceae bacterium]
MSKKQILTAVIGTIIAMIIGFAVICIWGMVKYVNETPAITPLENVTVSANSTITVEDVAIVEKSVYTTFGFEWADGRKETEAYSNDDYSEIHFGSDTGVCYITIGAKGSNSEFCDETVTVIVE